MACTIVRSDRDCDEGCCWQHFCAHEEPCDRFGNHLDLDGDEDED